jgi:HD-like signal output (HDOD) protein
MSEPSSIPTPEELRRAYAATKGAKVPSIPDILVKLNNELARPEPRNQYIVELILQEQSLTGTVLKTVNSAAFGLAQEVNSVAHAATLLGIGKLRNIILGALVQQHMKARSPLALQIWQDSLEVSKAALIIANMVDGISPDEAYLAGLLHDCGAMLMAEKWPDYEQAWSLSGSQPINMPAMEERRYGTKHTVVGYLFGRHWKLPERINQAIYGHHVATCSHISDNSTRALIAALKLANTLVDGRYLDDGNLFLERIQYLSRARSELMMDPADYELLAREAAAGF